MYSVFIYTSVYAYEYMSFTTAAKVREYRTIKLLLELLLQVIT